MIIVSLLIVVLIAAMLLGTRAKADLKAKYPAPGQMVDIGGYRLHINCHGTGSPTVVMEAGLTDPSLIWALVQPQIANTTRVCVYDRAGLGWSDASPKPRTAETMVAELHTFLTNANIPGPYVLMGHSTGGMLVRLYANNYPDEVVGMVLVDAQHEDQFERISEPQLQAVKDNFAQAHRDLSLLRGLILTGLCALRPAIFEDAGLPSPEREAFSALLVSEPKFVEARIAEYDAIFESLAEVRAAHITSVGNIPLVVISRGIYGGMIPGMNAEAEKQWWQELQTELAALSPQGSLVLANKSDHYIQLEQPELVIEAILQVLTTARR
jgi:pimeloyl-ACP methyl ester carboxylesterase